jgi:hypothetical protein
MSTITGIGNRFVVKDVAETWGGFACLRGEPTMKRISTGIIVFCVFLLAFAPAAEAGVRKGPYLMFGGNPSQMTVLWQLDAYQSCTIRWGLSTIAVQDNVNSQNAY